MKCFEVVEFLTAVVQYLRHPDQPTTAKDSCVGRLSPLIELYTAWLVRECLLFASVTVLAIRTGKELLNYKTKYRRRDIQR